MEEEIDIYADLPSIDLKSNKSSSSLCHCDELKKELGELDNKFKNIQKINETLERNLSSLLKTAKTEISRKDRIIDNLRKQLDDVAFRRNNGGFSNNFNHSSHKHPNPVETETRESAVSSMDLKEKEFMSHQTESNHDDERKSQKTQNNDRIPVTLFGERLRKRIMNDEMEEKQKAHTLPKLEAELEGNTKEISEECITERESDKENGSHTSINNNASESKTVAQNSNSEIPYRRNAEKRPNHENDMYKDAKRIKIEDNKNMTSDADYNHVTRYDVKDLAQNGVKDDPGKFEDRLDDAHSLTQKQTPFDSKCRAASENKDTKQDKSRTNGWRNDKNSNWAKDRDLRCRKGSVDSLKNSRVSSTSNESDHHRDHYVNGFRKNYHRHDSPNSKSYSRSRSDCPSYESHRLREKSRRMYKHKYDCKYDSRYTNDKLRRNYDSKENDSRTRYGNLLRRYDDTSNKFRRSSSDIEDREKRSSWYKSNKYDSRKIKEPARNVSDARSPESDKSAPESNFQASSRTTNIADNEHSAEKSIEQTIKNELYETPTKSVNGMPTKITVDTSNLEEGEILDSDSCFEKQSNPVKISRDNKMRENVKTISIEGKDKVSSMEASNLSKPILSKINARKSEETIETNSKDCGENFTTDISTIDQVRNSNDNGDTCESSFNETKVSSTQNITAIQQLRDGNIDDNNRQDYSDKNINSISESTVKVDEADKTTTRNETNNIDVECIKTDEAIGSKTDREIERSDNLDRKVEIVPNRNARDDGDECHSSVKSETTRRVSNESKVEASRLCLNDHNYVRNVPVASNPRAAHETPVESSIGFTKTVPKTATLKETKGEESVNVRSTVGVKKMTFATKSKKEEKSKPVVISRRRRAVTLSDSSASMTVLMNTVKAPAIDNDSALKPRACKLVRVCKSVL